VEWLNILFNSEENTVNRVEKIDFQISEGILHYVSGFKEKKELIDNLQDTFGEKINIARRLKEIINGELIDSESDKKKEIISDIKSLEHSNKIRRVQKLEACLGYATTKYEHVYELSRHLFSTLITEIELIEQIPQSDLRKFRKITDLLKKNFLVEEEIVQQISSIRTFHKLFLELSKGEQIIKKLDKSEKRLAELMNKDMPIDGITDRWVMAVFEGIEDKVYELVSNNQLDTHPNMHFEFVNRPEFVELVREKITILRKRPVTDGMINAFVHLFRDKYNREVE